MLHIIILPPINTPKVEYRMPIRDYYINMWLNDCKKCSPVRCGKGKMSKKEFLEIIRRLKEE